MHIRQCHEERDPKSRVFIPPEGKPYHRVCIDLQNDAATTHCQSAQNRITQPMALLPHDGLPVGSIAHGRRLDIRTTVTAIAGLHTIARLHVAPIVLISIATLLMIPTSDAVTRRIIRCATSSTHFLACRIIRRSSSSHGHVRVRRCSAIALHLANFVQASNTLWKQSTLRIV
jgi:hypothetical protein